MRTINLFAEFNIFDNYAFIAALAAITLLFLLVILLFLRFSNLSKDVDKNSEYRRNQSAKHFTTQSNVNTNTDILDRLEKLEKATQAGTRSAIVAAVVAEASTETEKPYEVELSLPEKPKVIEFYMSTPNPDGTFEANQSSDVFRKTISLFKFTASPKNPSTATFEFYSDESGMKDALSNPKTYLTPVCYEENDAFTGAKKIVVQKLGTAVKTGDKWVVDKNERLRIKYQ